MLTAALVYVVMDALSSLVAYYIIVRYRHRLRSFLLRFLTETE